MNRIILRYSFLILFIILLIGLITTNSLKTTANSLKTTANLLKTTANLENLEDLTEQELKMSSLNNAVVIGSGLAGLSATIELLSKGLFVTLLEMDSKFGGNSIKASSGINGVPTKFQPPLEKDTQEFFYDDTIKSSGVSFKSSSDEIKELRKILIKTLTDDSATSINWLTDKIGVDLSVVAQLGGHSKARTHRGSGKIPPGASIIKSLLNYIDLNFKNSIDLKLNSKLTKIIRDDISKRVKGIEFKDLETNDSHVLNSNIVIMTTGGFAGDSKNLLAKFRPDLLNYPSTNSPTSNSIELLTDLGADLIDMDQVQIHPTGFIDPNDEESLYKFLAAEALRGEGGILVNKSGDRFVNEMLPRDELTEKIIELSSKLNEDKINRINQWENYLILDESSANRIKSNIDFYCFKKLMQKVKISELSQLLPNIKSTLLDYSSIVNDNQKNDELGRSNFGSWSLSPESINNDETVLYIGRTTPVTHFTMGGAKINENGQILNKDLSPISGIYGAGEITGGVHGSNRLGGSSLLECVVFGRKSAQHAFNYLQESSKL
ncbi:hypothetical protein B5S33_g1845 [[Candida] boidinii]|nr:hypothetical protein B5S33_g1845 [[Candida] boidinii]